MNLSRHNNLDTMPTNSARGGCALPALARFHREVRDDKGNGKRKVYSIARTFGGPHDPRPQNVSLVFFVVGENFNFEGGGARTALRSTRFPPSGLLACLVARHSTSGLPVIRQFGFLMEWRLHNESDKWTTASLMSQRD